MQVQLLEWHKGFAEIIVKGIRSEMIKRALVKVSDFLLKKLRLVNSTLRHSRAHQ